MDNREGNKQPDANKTGMWPNAVEEQLGASERSYVRDTADEHNATAELDLGALLWCGLTHNVI